MKRSLNLPRRGCNKPAQGIALGDNSGRGTLALKGRNNNVRRKLEFS